MNKIVGWIVLAILGMGLSMLGAFIGGSMALIFVLLGSFMMLFPLVTIIGIAKDKNLLPIFDKLKKFEKMVLYIINNRYMLPLIFNTRDEGILEKDKVGMIEDKGTELYWGKVPISIAVQGTGVTLDLKDVAYTGVLGDKRDIRSYEDAIKQYLGPDKYINFEKVYRIPGRKPDWDAIRGEMKFLLKQEPHDPLTEEVLGETLDFRWHLNHLMYAYDPMVAKNAVDKRVMAAEHQAMQYKQTDKAMGYAKAFAVVMIVIVIFLIAIQNVDFGGIIGSFFGGS